MFKKEKADDHLVDTINKIMKFENDLVRNLIKGDRVLSFGDTDIIKHNHLLASLYEQYDETLVDSIFMPVYRNSHFISRFRSPQSSY